MERDMATTNIATVIDTTPEIVFSDKGKADELFAHIEAEIAAFKPDLTTDTGRKAIASLAYKVAQTKTAIDAAGKKLTEDARKQIDAVNAERNRFKARLQELQDRARLPLDQWEEADEKRREEVQEILAALRKSAIILASDTAAQLRTRLELVRSVLLRPEVLQGNMPVAELERDRAVSALGEAIARAVKAEADAAELEALRTAQRKREEEEAAAAAAQQEADRKAAEAAETKRREEQAAEDARAAAAYAAEQEKLATQRRHDEELAAEKRRADETVAAAKRKEDEAAAAKAAEEKARQKREADQRHRETVMDEAAFDLALVAGNVPAKTLRAIAAAIAAGEISHVRMEF